MISVKCTLNLLTTTFSVEEKRLDVMPLLVLPQTQSLNLAQVV